MRTKAKSAGVAVLKQKTTYDLEDLMERYHCSGPRILSWIDDHPARYSTSTPEYSHFPKYTVGGRKYFWSILIVTEWELIYMPHLHTHYSRAGVPVLSAGSPKVQAVKELKREANAKHQQAQHKLAVAEATEARTRHAFLEELKVDQQTRAATPWNVPPTNSD